MGNSGAGITSSTCVKQKRTATFGDSNEKHFGSCAAPHSFDSLTRSGDRTVCRNAKILTADDLRFLCVAMYSSISISAAVSAAAR